MLETNLRKEKWSKLHQEQFSNYRLRPFRYKSAGEAEKQFSRVPFQGTLFSRSSQAASGYCQVEVKHQTISQPSSNFPCNLLHCSFVQMVSVSKQIKCLVLSWGMQNVSWNVDFLFLVSTAT